MGRGPGKLSMMRSRSLSQAIQEGVPGELLRDFHVAIVERRVRVRFERVASGEHEGDLRIAWDDEGIPPSDELVHASVRWLSDRGYGLPAQSIHLEQHVRGAILHAGASIDLAGALSAGTMAQMLELVRGTGADAARGALPSGDGANSDAIDAEYTEHDGADSGAQGDADED